MTGWLVFDSMPEPLEMGKAVYTILRLPPGVAAALRDAGATRVEGEINDHPVNLGVSGMPGAGGPFLWAGKSLRDRVGLRPGVPVAVRLRPAAAEAVETPDDVLRALALAELTVAWEGLTRGKRRGLLYRFETARTGATRQKRIAAMVAGLCR